MVDDPLLSGWSPSHTNLLLFSLLSQDSPLITAGPRYIALAWTAQTQFPTVTPLLCVTQPLPSNGCFSGSTVFALSKYVTKDMQQDEVVRAGFIWLWMGISGMVMNLKCWEILY
jgi:hypothetical protein